jgi:uncharacterized membrane protein YkvA (DUF1232 family)
MANDHYRKYRQHFSESAFKRKLSKISGEVCEKAMVLYLVFQNPQTPVWVKILIVSVLAYLIAPMDAVPDALPIIGYVDDLAAIAALLARIEHLITPEIRQKARQK